MGFGYTQILWMKESASYGSAEDMSTGTRLVLFVRPDISLEKTIDYVKSDHVRQTSGIKQEDELLGKEGVAGSFGGLVPCGSLVTGTGDWTTLLKTLLGKVVTGTVSGTKYTHTFTWNDKLFYGLSLAVNRAGASYAYHGCQPKSLTLSAKVGGGLEWTADVLGASEVQSATITPPTVPGLTASPSYWLFQHGVFKIDTVVEPITEFSIDLTRDLTEGDDQSYALGSVTRAMLASSAYGVTGTVKRRHDLDATTVSKFYAKYLTGASAALLLTFTHPTDADYTMVITLGVTRFKGETPKAKDKGPIMESIPFVCYDLEAATSSIVVTDKCASPVTATGAYDGAGA